MVRLTLYASDMPADSEADHAVRDWLSTMRDTATAEEGERPVWRLELLAEGRTAVDAVAGMPDWRDVRNIALYATGCASDGPRLVLRRFTFDAVPPAIVLPYFQPEEERGR